MANFQFLELKLFKFRLNNVQIFSLEIFQISKSSNVGISFSGNLQFSKLKEFTKTIRRWARNLKQKYVSAPSSKKKKGQLIPIKQVTPATLWLRKHPRLNSTRKHAI